MPNLSSTTPYYGGGQVANPANVIQTSGAPSTNALDKLGTLAVDPATGTVYCAAQRTSGSTTWAVLGGGASDVNTINGLSPTAGDIVIAGTANQVGVANAGSTVTLSLPAAITAPGSLATTTTLTAGTGLTITTGGATVSAGNVTLTSGNLVINGAAKQLQVHGGAVTDFIGQATLSSGTVSIANTNIAATDRVSITRRSINGSTALGTLEGVVSAGATLVINARNPTDATIQTNDVSIVDYVITRQV